MKKTGLPNEPRSSVRRGLLIALTAAFVLSISILLAINAAGLRWELNQSTQAYLRDVTTQTANDIRGTMQHKIRDLQTVSSSISILRESGGDVQGLLDEQADLLEFEPLILVDKQGETMTSSLWRFCRTIPSRLLSGSRISRHPSKGNLRQLFGRRNRYPVFHPGLYRRRGD